MANYPPYDLSAAPEVIDLAASAGLHLDEWQKFVLTHGLGQHLNGEWTAKRVSCWVPRQNGKGGIIEALELAWLFLPDLAEDLIIHSAHQSRTAQRAYVRMERIVRRTPWMHRKVGQYRQSNGKEQLELRDGRMLQYTTRSPEALRGFSTGKGILDEAQELTSDQIAAITPTVSAIPFWQLWFFGTPPDDPTAWVYGLKEDGEAGVARLAHFDWGLDLNLEDPADQARVHDLGLALQANPAMGDAPGCRIEIATVQDEMRPSGLGVKYPQERLGVWQPRAAGGAGVISEALWNDLADRSGIRPEDRAFAVVVNAIRTYTAIAAVGPRPDGTLLASIVEYRPGTAWVPERLAQLKSKWNPVAIAVEDKGPTGSLLPDLKKVGIVPPEGSADPKRGDLVVPWASNVAAAYGMVIDALRQRRLFHLDEAPLNLAAANGDTRPLSGATAWDYRTDDIVDTSPLRAMTNALWAYVTRIDAVTSTYDPMANIG